MTLARMGIGLITQPMVMFGFPKLQMGFLLIQQTDTGCSLMKDGPGFQTIHGDGRPFITAVGFTKTIMDGSGFRIINGARDGLPGEDQMTIMDGRP